jgi:1-aminocyclopropane-1-carboxylate deaminase/D-cysteine desulfhydrase-like pyridoxal-dependent ACC family enzyme
MATIVDTKLSRAALQARIDALPRVRLAHLPTPLEHCPRLSAALGGVDVWIKRDDLTGLAFGGNKTRQLESLFADILAVGADTVVAGAYTQSNWCRQITGAARKLGLEVALILLHGERGPALQGNLLLDRLMGADVTVVDLDSMERLTPLLEAKRAELARAGRKPYVVRPFGLDKLMLGALGYVNGALELDAQLETAGIDPDFLYLCGANMTPAGMLLGLRALGRRTKLVSIAPIVWSEPRAIDIARIAGAAAARLEIEVRIAPADIENHDAFIGERYGVVPEGAREALRLVAGTEGIPRPGVQRQGDGRADRSRAHRPHRPGPDGRVPAHRRHARSVRLRGRARSATAARSAGALSRRSATPARPAISPRQPTDFPVLREDYCTARPPVRAFRPENRCLHTQSGCLSPGQAIASAGLRYCP